MELLPFAHRSYANEARAMVEKLAPPVFTFYTTVLLLSRRSYSDVLRWKDFRNMQDMTNKANHFIPLLR